MFDVRNELRPQKFQERYFLNRDPLSFVPSRKVISRKVANTIENNSKERLPTAVYLKR
jgi:hypothetical protein